FVKHDLEDFRKNTATSLSDAYETEREPTDVLMLLDLMNDFISNDDEAEVTGGSTE
ncbi:hypothetical protein L9F63_011991, partial [Diploptera punctata]